MKKNGKAAKKLTLHRDTLTALGDASLVNAAGGATTPIVFCRSGYTCPECASPPTE